MRVVLIADEKFVFRYEVLNPDLTIQIAIQIVSTESPLFFSDQNNLRRTRSIQANPMKTQEIRRTID